ncbi:MAG: cobalamin biosynthesis protein CobG [Pseudomonadota bacterium]
MTGQITQPTVKGWCPHAYRPMESGDGLILRLRPLLGRLTRPQMLAVCEVADAAGNGILDLTSRGNLQVRGLDVPSHQEAVIALLGADVIMSDPFVEQRRALLIDPFWRAGDLSVRLATQLVNALRDFPKLPGKAGFAIDTGTQPCLQSASADIRFELSETGALVIRADGVAGGLAVAETDAIAAAIEVAGWYAARVSGGRGRLRDLIKNENYPCAWQSEAVRRQSELPSYPGSTPIGQQVAVPFGQIAAKTLRTLAETSSGIRLTPWRTLVLEGIEDFRHPELIHTSDHPLLRADACPGAPRCASAFIDTRRIARLLAPLTRGSLHVSGCAKGCARQARADLTIVGTQDGFDIVRGGTAQTPPDQTRFAECDLLAGTF